MTERTELQQLQRSRARLSRIFLALLLVDLALLMSWQVAAHYLVRGGS